MRDPNKRSDDEKYAPGLGICAPYDTEPKDTTGDAWVPWRSETEPTTAAASVTCFAEYEAKRIEFAVYKKHGPSLDGLYPALGMCGEAGEIANKIKKIVRDGRPVNEATSEERAADALERLEAARNSYAEDITMPVPPLDSFRYETGTLSVGPREGYAGRIEGRAYFDHTGRDPQPTVTVPLSGFAECARLEAELAKVRAENAVLVEDIAKYREAMAKHSTSHRCTPRPGALVTG